MGLDEGDDEFRSWEKTQIRTGKAPGQQPSSQTHTPRRTGPKSMAPPNQNVDPLEVLDQLHRSLTETHRSLHEVFSSDQTHLERVTADLTLSEESLDPLEADLTEVRSLHSFPVPSIRLWYRKPPRGSILS